MLELSMAIESCLVLETSWRIAFSTLDHSPITMLATSKSGTLSLRRDQGEMAVLWDSRSRRL